jgi:YhcH/YjgK/YiaL family protein
MKNIFIKIMVLSSLFGLFACKGSTDPASWSSEKIDKWFEKGEWLNGWNITPDESINRKEFAVSYFKNKERWDKAFTFLKSNDLSKLEIKRYEIDGDIAFAPVSEYLSKNEEDARFEAHKNYIDIQYVISGVEQMSVAPYSALDSITVAYDPAKEVEFMTVKESRHFKATQENFFIFFPSDIHRPGLKVGENTMIKKIVVKVKVD